MSIQEITPAVERLAQRLEDDIRSRGLRQGNRYLTTIEAGHLLGVSPATAHKALKLLADRKMLVRRSKMGTFVGSGAGSLDDVGIQTVFVLATEEKKEHTFRRLATLLRALDRVMPSVHAQLHFIPHHNVEDHLRKLLVYANSGGKVIGAVAGTCPAAVYRALAAAEVRTVISGTPPVDGPKFPSVDMDNREAGRLLAEYLVDRGHRRIALVATSLDRPGDKLQFEGISESLTAARLPHNALIYQIVSENQASVSACIEHLLAEDNPPSGFIARGEIVAGMVHAALRERDRDETDNLEVVFADHRSSETEKSPLVHVRSQMDRDESSMLLAEMLKKLVNDEPLQQRKVVIPVELCRRQDLDPAK